MKTNKHINDMTIQEFLDIPTFIKKDAVIRSVVIVPTGEMHDSGYQCMRFILVGENGLIVGAVGGGSDVVHIDGIGGAGINRKFAEPKMPIPWKFDCLPTSGCLRLFCHAQLFTAPFINVVSDFEVIAKDDTLFKKD